MIRPSRLLVAIAAIAVAAPLSMAAPALAGPPVDCNPGGSGAGTADDPYLVSTQAQLEAIGSDASCVDKVYVQTGDIALTGQWSPIGYVGPQAFSGIYYGGCYAIDGLSIGTSGSPDPDDTGMFRATDAGAVFANMRLTNVSVYGDSSSGNAALVAYPNDDTLFQELSVSGSVSGDYYTGLVAGDAGESNFYRVFTSGSVTGSRGNVGGVAGYGKFVEQSYSTATVTGRGDIGGLLGAGYYGGEIVDSYATGAASGRQNGVGALVGSGGGFTSTFTVESSYATGAVSATSGTPLLGGLVGTDGGAFANLATSYVASFWDSQTTGQATTADGTSTTTTGAKTTVQMKTATTFTGATPAWDADVWTIQNGSYPTLTWAANGIQGTCPGISTVAPSAGAAGSSVTITGTRLGDVSQVYFGETEATDFTVDSDTSITATVPAGTGTVDVSVETTVDFISEDTISIPLVVKAGAFTYASPTPPAPEPTPTPTPTPTATPKPTVDPLDPIGTTRNPNIPAGGLPPGGSLLLVNGQPQAVTVAPDANRNPSGLDVSGDGWRMKLVGRGDTNDPLGLSEKSALILQSIQIRAKVSPVAEASGTGFKPNSPVKFYLLPSTYLGELITDASGAFSGKVPVPPGIAIGNYTMQLNGYSPADQVRSLNLGVEVKGTGKVATAKARGKVLFDALSAELTPAARAELRSLARKARAGAVRTVVIGYVQPTSVTSNDETLSTRRAKAVAAYLRSLGVTGKYQVSGEGVAPQTDRTARRVDVTITYRR